VNGNVRKIDGLSAGETSKFESTVVENTTVRSCQFREILTLIVWPFSKDYKFIS